MLIIGGKFGSHKLLMPKESKTRPTTSRLRATFFNICQFDLENVIFLDLFAGSGAIGLEALSRGSMHTTFVDIHSSAIHCIQHNVSNLKLQEKCHIIKGDVFVILSRLEKQNAQFDIIYADPPYCTLTSHDKYYSTEIVEWIDNHNLLKIGGMLFVEEEFCHKPTLLGLHSLRLKSSRRVGISALQQYLRMH